MPITTLQNEKPQKDTCYEGLFLIPAVTIPVLCVGVIVATVVLSFEFALLLIPLVVLALAGIAIYFLCKRRKNKQDASNSPAEKNESIKPPSVEVSSVEVPSIKTPQGEVSPVVPPLDRTSSDETFNNANIEHLSSNANNMCMCFSGNNKWAYAIEKAKGGASVGLRGNFGGLDWEKTTTSLKKKDDKFYADLESFRTDEDGCALDSNNKHGEFKFIINEDEWYPSGPGENLKMKINRK